MHTYVVGIVRKACRARCMHMSGVRPSVCLSVCPIRSPHAAAAGLLLWARRVEIFIDCCTAGMQRMNAGSATFSANVVAEHRVAYLFVLLQTVCITFARIPSVKVGLHHLYGRSCQPALLFIVA